MLAQQHRGMVGFPSMTTPPPSYTGIPLGPASPNAMAASMAGANAARKQPVEFNHAINYVNKIKARSSFTQSLTHIHTDTFICSSAHNRKRSAPVVMRLP
jgi:histone deacetylase complex regulatory component SIN3